MSGPMAVSANVDTPRPAMTASELAAWSRAGKGQGDGSPPLIAHVLFHYGVGGLESGVTNLINAMPRDAFRHAIVCVKGASDFTGRLKRSDVPVITLGKRDGIEPGAYVRAWRVLRQLRPTIVHTRNIAALEMQLPALLAGVPCRVHSEHGREGVDSDGTYRRYNLVRKALRPAVHRYIGLSRDLQRWLIERIEVPAHRVAQIYNGVNTERFSPATAATRVAESLPRLAGATFVIGAVGRLAAVKDHLSLVRAVHLLVRGDAVARKEIRLVIVGEGPCRAECEAEIRALGLDDVVWLAGERADVPDLMRAMQVFCLPSLNEGINNTLLEAMACGLPVVATRVGGNPELLSEDVTGMLVPARDPASLADALRRYWRAPDMRRAHGAAGRARAVAEFGIDRMVQQYLALYRALCSDRHGVRHA